MGCLSFFSKQIDEDKISHLLENVNHNTIYASPQATLSKMAFLGWNLGLDPRFEEHVNDGIAIKLFTPQNPYGIVCIGKTYAFTSILCRLLKKLKGVKMIECNFHHNPIVNKILLGKIDDVFDKNHETCSVSEYTKSRNSFERRLFSSYVEGAFNYKEIDHIISFCITFYRTCNTFENTNKICTIVVNPKIVKEKNSFEIEVSKTDAGVYPKTEYYKGKFIRSFNNIDFVKKYFDITIKTVEKSPQIFGEHVNAGITLELSKKNCQCLIYQGKLTKIFKTLFTWFITIKDIDSIDCCYKQKTPDSYPVFDKINLSKNVINNWDKGEVLFDKKKETELLSNYIFSNLIFEKKLFRFHVEEAFCFYKLKCLTKIKIKLFNKEEIFRVLISITTLDPTIDIKNSLFKVKVIRKYTDNNLPLWKYYERTFTCSFNKITFVKEYSDIKIITFI
jgi:hypothetical protein